MKKRTNPFSLLIVLFTFTISTISCTPKYPSLATAEAKQGTNHQEEPLPIATELLTTEIQVSHPNTPTITSIASATYLPIIPRKPKDITYELLQNINLERTLQDILKLTGEVPICIDDDCYSINDRATGSEGLYWAKRYIFHELLNLGYFVEYKDWSMSGYSDQNIFAIKPGFSRPDEKIYFIAHLDGSKANILSGKPAADDNASSVVDLLELARVLSNYSFERTLVLFISTGEEQGTLGVTSYLDQLTPEEISSIKYAVNIDMVGYDANRDYSMELWYGDHAPSFDLVTVMSQTIQTYQLNLIPEFVVGCG
jgi:hypothetical protein